MIPDIDLENLLTHPEGFGLTTATPVQRAICRVSTGVPLGDLASHPHVIEAFGGEQAIAMLPKKAPRMFVLIAGIRSGKTLFAAAKAFRASQMCDLSGLKPGEIPRIPLVSVLKDQAAAAYDHLRGTMLARPLLRQTLVREPTRESIFVRHPSGRTVEIRLVATSRAGRSLVGRWNVGAIFDEAPRMQGQEDGVINLPDALSAIRGRFLGGSIDLIGSPWAPRGTVYQLFLERFGRPGEDLVIVRAPGAMMNPSRYTPEFLQELAHDDPRAYKTDALALFADAADSLLSATDVEICTRKIFPGSESIEYVPGQSYVAAIDPATRGNAWTLVIVTSTEPGKYQVVRAQQWQGSASAPLSPREVLKEIGLICSLYRIDSVFTDQHNYDSFTDLVPPGLTLLLSPWNQELWRTTAERLRTLIGSHKIELPPNQLLRSDLLGIQRSLTTTSWKPLLSTTRDGRHSDYVPSLCLCLEHLPDAPSDIHQRTITREEAGIMARLQQDPWDQIAERFA